MIIYFANRNLVVLGSASVYLPGGLQIVQDSKVEDVEVGVTTFECTIEYENYQREEAEILCANGNYVLRNNGEYEREFYTIIDTEQDIQARTIHIYCEDAGLDLLNDVAPPFDNYDVHDIEFYVNKYIKNSGWEININEIGYAPKLLLWWDKSETVTARLKYIMDMFGVEFCFGFDIDGMQVTRRYINIMAPRGKNVGEQLRLGKEIGNIRARKSIANLATSIIATGGYPEGSQQPITLKGYLYDDGDIFVDKNGELKSRKYNEYWRRYYWENIKTYDGYLSKVVNYSDALTKKELFEMAKSDLEFFREEELNYDIDVLDLPYGTTVGDYVSIIDDQGLLYISSRILQMTTSVTENKINAIVGDYLIVDSGISQEIQDLADRFVELEHMEFPAYTWIIYADDDKGLNPSITSVGKMYIGFSSGHTEPLIDISQIKDISIFTFNKVLGEDGSEIKDIKQEYYVSTNPDTLEGGEWTTELNDKDFLDGNKTVFTRDVVYMNDPEHTVVRTTAINATALNVVAGKIVAQEATIKKLNADKIEVKDLTAENLKATVVEAVNLSTATINSQRIETGKFLTGDLTADKGMIDEVWADEVMVKSKFIGHNGTFFELTAVHINADDITTGTLTADRILLKNAENGLYYQMNVNAEGAQGYTPEQLQNGMLGSNIIAHSITATEITTENIVGTGGWINLKDGTFKFVNNPESVNGTSNAWTRGIEWDGKSLNIKASNIYLGDSTEDLEIKMQLLDEKASKAGNVGEYIIIKTDNSGGYGPGIYFRDPVSPTAVVSRLAIEGDEIAFRNQHGTKVSWVDDSKLHTTSVEAQSIIVRHENNVNQFGLFANNDGHWGVRLV